MITGVGVVAPTGLRAERHWAATLAGTARIAPLENPPPQVRVAGRVADFDEKAHVPGRLRVQTDRWTWMAVAATGFALDDAALDPREQDPYSMAVVTASGSGGNEFGQREIQALWSNGPKAVSAYQSIGWFYAASSGQLSILHGLKGPCGVLVADTAGGIDALAQARRLVRRGTRIVVTGGTEAPLSPYALVCQSSQETLSGVADPRSAYLPFDRRATGHVPGEGGAMLVVEELEEARERGAPRLYAEIAGTAATHDAHHPTARVSGHRQLARAMWEAIERAGCAPEDIDAVFADGSGDARADGSEAAAIHEVFGAAVEVPVTVPKTMTGRLNSGGAALDLATAALALHHDCIPPTVNVEVCDHGLDLVLEPRWCVGLRWVLVVARGVGGFNSAAVLRAVE